MDAITTPVGEQVLAGEQPLFDAHGHAALEQNGLAGLCRGDQELEVLGVARADLEDVGVFGDEVRVVLGQEFRDDGQAGVALSQ